MKTSPASKPPAITVRIEKAEIARILGDDHAAGLFLGGLPRYLRRYRDRRDRMAANTGRPRQVNDGGDEPK